MANVTLKDIALKQFRLEDLVLLRRLREKAVTARPEVCIERARHMTRYYRDNPEGAAHAVVRSARAVSYFLSNKEPLFPDESLLAGTTTSKYCGAPVYPEFTGMTIWPELDTISTRQKNPLLLDPEDAAALNLDIFPYWMERNALEQTRAKHKNPRSMQLFERIIFFLAGKAGCISHTVPAYRIVLEKGVDGIIAEARAREALVRNNGSPTREKEEKLAFYQAVRAAMEGVKAYARKLCVKAAELSRTEPHPAKRANYRAMSAVLARVPAQPARSFREAMNSLWIAQVAVHAENINMAISPGRLDQLLYPYYRNDIDNGTLSVKDAIELVGCLWLKLNDNTNLVPETAEELFGGAGTVPAVTVGGVDQRGEDAVNDLTYIMLRVTELLKTRDPSLNARYHYEKNPREYRDRVAEVIARTKSVPAFHNDVADIDALAQHGVQPAHARDFAIIGCVELASSGRSYDASSSIMLNLVSVLELALYNGRRPVTGDEVISFASGDPRTFEGFGEFLEAFKKQLAWIIAQAVELNNLFGRVYQEALPTPLLSAFFEGPLERGKDLIMGGAVYNSSGATHIGFADTVDSLSAVEQAVYRDRRCTWEELLQALKTDFAHNGKLQAYLVNMTPKYGTRSEIADRNACDLVEYIHALYQGYENYRGGRYRPAYWTMTNHAGQGRLSGALPSGRRAGRVFASGITPASQAAARLDACLGAVGALPGRLIPGGEALNLKFPSVDPDDPEDTARLGAAVEAYFRSGGLHVQFNIMSYEMLIDAKKDPGKYPELLVRVSGYSAYFNDLNEAMKDEIITRTQYGLHSGKMDAFPVDRRDMLPTVSQV